MIELNNMEEKIRRKLGSDRVSVHVPMSQYTSFRAGGKADLMIIPESEDELKWLLTVLNEEECPFFVLGNGTNVLVRDGGYRGVVIRLGEGFKTIDRHGEDLVCGSAVLLSAIAKCAQQEGLGGMEFASGIPGTIGGAVFMNAGAYDREISDILAEVRTVSIDGSSVRNMTPGELELGYRTSLIQNTKEVITEVRLHLHEDDPDEIAGTMADLMARRNSKQPVNMPSAGSFFKRPKGHFAGKLIEDAGLKGLSVGGAQVSELHAGFIVNKGDATVRDITRLMTIIQARVKKEFGVDLEPEVRLIGEDAKN